MSCLPYGYLFPFEKVPADSHILIYGAGALGQEYLKQILITGYCTVNGFVDKNYMEYKSMIVPVYAPEEIHKLSFDYIVIALRVSFALNEIKRILAEQEVDKEKICYVLERTNTNPVLFSAENEQDVSEHCSCDLESFSIALYMGGGIGDMVNQKRFVMELIQLVPNAKIDIYIVKNEAFMKWFYSDCPEVKNIIMDLGTRYAERKDRYSLSVSVIASVLLQVDHVSPETYANGNEVFLKRIRLLETRCQDEGLSITIPNGVAFHRRIYQGVNCYTWFNYGDVFSIRDFRVSIPFLEQDRIAFKQLGLNRYVTFNAGNGACGDEKQVAKCWPVERFRETISRLKRRYPDIQVIQIGADGEESLREADVCLMGQTFGLIAWVLRGAIFHLDIEGGLVHLASQIGTKCIVLFGPTSMEYNSYEGNINIRASSCHNCYGMYLDSSRCARHMEEPECMYSITPDMVMDEIDNYMSTLEIGRMSR